MKKALVPVCLILMALAVPRPAHAWGYAGHRLIMARAIDLLPPALKPFFEHFKSEVVVRVVDPDTWRNVGWAEEPNHFIDFGVPEYGPFPFTALPRDYTAALETFGRATLERNGYLPWREAEMFGNLRRAFEGFGRRSPYATSDVILLSAVASHYIQDAHQPLHATDNFDGQQTGNRGIHSRFERDLIERFAGRLRLSPGAPTPMVNPRDTTFDIALESYPEVDKMMAADKAALGSKNAYDDEYFEAFFTAIQPLLERQLSKAISATAGVIIGAWEQAGRPPVTTTDARPLERVRP